MFRFTIRDLLWLMVVVALAVAWWVDRSEVEEGREVAMTRAAKLESALQTSMGWLKGYEMSNEIARSLIVGRLPPVQKQQVELTPELIEHPEPSWVTNPSAPATNPPSE